MEKRKTIEEYDILRVLVTILVVIGHAGYYKIKSEYGGCDYSSYADQMGIVYKLFQSGVVKLIYSFHMPLFIALSGALFHLSYKKKKFETLVSLMSAKSKRLLIPFFSITFFYAFPLKWLSGYFQNDKPLIVNLLVGELLLQGNSYLWYLVTLFCIFILFYLLLKLRIPPFGILGICLMLNLISYLVDVHLIQYICRQIIWFSVGFYFDESREKINFRIKKSVCILNGIVFVVIFGMNTFLKLSQCAPMKFMMNLAVAFLGCCFVYTLSYLLTKTKITNNKFFQFTAQNSFGLYLYSDPMNYLFLLWSTTWFGSVLFSNNAYALFYITIRILINFAVGYVLTTLLRKFGCKYII